MEFAASTLIVEGIAFTAFALLCWAISVSLRGRFGRLWSSYWTAFSAGLILRAAAIALPSLRMLWAPLVMAADAACVFFILRTLAPNRARRFGHTVFVAALLIIVLDAALARAGRYEFAFAGQEALFLVTALFATPTLQFFSRTASPAFRLVLATIWLVALLAADHIVTIAVLTTRGERLSPQFWNSANIGVVVLVAFVALSSVIASMDRIRVELERYATQLGLSRDRLAQIAEIDPLTKLKNRYALQTLASRYSGGLPEGSLLMVDVDDLKVINDRFGHAAGDLALCAIADRLLEVTRPNDQVFRWGGDEFVALLFGVQPEIARRRAHEMLRVPFEHGEVRASWGVAAFADGRPLELVMADADRELYTRKAESPALESDRT